MMMNKFKMKGHSIPGIKGFKGTSKEDGRAASSAFQIKTPLLEETRTTLDANTEVVLPGVTDRSTSNPAASFAGSFLDNLDLPNRPKKEKIEEIPMREIELLPTTTEEPELAQAVWDESILGPNPDATEEE